jgi:crossover junction endodeoxyribonuclease RuvC
MYKSSPIYLGIDPGTMRIGYGVIESTTKGLVPLAWGVIENSPQDPAGARQRTRRAIKSLIKQWRPVAVGIERLFFLNNQRTAMSVSEMRGVILLTLTDAQIPIHEFTPLEVKQRVCGHGRADKRQVEKMVRLLLQITKEIKPDDAADGLALAICCTTVQKSY